MDPFPAFNPYISNSSEIDPFPVSNPYISNTSDHYFEETIDSHVAGPRRKTIHMASFDGGGGRGIMPAKIAEKIEELTQLRMSQCYKRFGGVSVGAFIAAGLNYTNPENPQEPPYTAKDLVELFEKETSNIFPEVPYIKYPLSFIWPYYSTDGVHKVLTKYFKDSLLCDSINNIVIPACEMSSNKPWWFSSSKIKSHSLLTISPEAFNKLRIIDVLEATSAAPTYFSPKEMTLDNKKYWFRDGGIFANDPAMYLYTNTFANYGPSCDYSLTSFGTGTIVQDSMLEPENNSGLLFWASNFASVAMGMTAQNTKMELENLFITEGEGQNLFTFQPTISLSDFTLDGSSKEHIQRLSDAADACIEEHHDELRTLCLNLITEYYAEDRVQLQEF